ncbi:MAG: hypothetical protein LPK85_08485 [Gammaproteobacteria bacterium]|nr:hypothetical protein [Gammaproteobacteria bacterium]
MKVTELAKHWEGPASTENRPNTYRLRLPLEDAARIEALAELFPAHRAQDILNDMVSAALETALQTKPLKTAFAEAGKVN